MQIATHTGGDRSPCYCLKMVLIHPLFLCVAPIWCVGMSPQCPNTVHPLYHGMIYCGHWIVKHAIQLVARAAHPTGTVIGAEVR